jgi:hypothetical protein
MDDDPSRHKKTACAGCGYLVDSATFLGDGKKVPTDGDISVCFRCGTLAVFEGGVPRPPVSPEEIAAAEQDPEVQRAQLTTRTFWAVKEVKELKARDDYLDEIKARLRASWEILRLT